MQAGVDAFGQPTVDAFHLHQLLDAGSLDALHSAKRFQQRRASARANARYVFQHAAFACLLTPFAVTSDGEAVSLVTHGGNQVQRGRG